MNWDKKFKTEKEVIKNRGEMAFMTFFSRKNKVVIVTGGGKTAREYIKSLEKTTKNNWMLKLLGWEKDE